MPRPAKPAARSATAPPARSGRKPVDFGELPGLLGFPLRIAQIAVFRDFHARIDALSLTPASFSVLEILHRNPGLTQTRLAQAVRLDRSSLVPLLDRLEQRALVRREASTTDRRQNHLFLAAAGTALRNVAMQKVREHDAHVSAVLTPAERRMLLRLLAKLA